MANIPPCFATLYGKHIRVGKVGQIKVEGAEGERVVGLGVSPSGNLLPDSWNLHEKGKAMFESIPPKHRRTVAIATKAATATGVPGILFPTADTLGITAIWTTMTWKIAEEAGHPMDKAAAAKFASASLSGIMSYMVGSKILTWGLHLIPGLGTLGGMAINSALNGLFTYRFGRYAISQFRRPNFTTDNMMDTAVKLVSVIIVLPTGKEIKEMMDLITGLDMAA